ncbi:MAG: hypothetical protein AAAB17_09995 [Pseudomonas sp.]
MGSDEIQYYILSPDHKPVPVDLLTWGAWFEQFENRRVALDEGEDGKGKWRLSSVCLGLDHSFSDNGPPILFETMLFREDTEADDHNDGWRFATWDEIMSFHRRKAAELRGIRLVSGGAA